MISEDDKKYWWLHKELVAIEDAVRAGQMSKEEANIRREEYWAAFEEHQSRKKKIAEMVKKASVWLSKERARAKQNVAWGECTHESYKMIDRCLERAGDMSRPVEARRLLLRTAAVDLDSIYKEKKREYSAEMIKDLNARAKDPNAAQEWRRRHELLVTRFMELSL
ncbi:hypothetical protein IWZ01DRAFT_539462 [Phyllosticta capitalensis]